MPHKKYLLFLLSVFAILVLNARVANACSCGPRPTVLDSYEKSDVVVIVRIVAVEVSGEGTRQSGSAKMVVEKVYKGNLKVGEEMVFGQGGGADCIWTFEKDDIDQQILFYVNTPKESPKRWYAVTCGRSMPVNYAGDDLLYLNNLKKAQGRSRISGRIGFIRYTDWSVEGRKIRIIGANKTYEVKTDRNGVYEIYDLPAGKYLIEPETPFGWKVDYYWLRYSASFAGNEEDRQPRKIPIMLEAKRHAGLEIIFEIDNAISGRVFDPSGNPMKDVCVKAVEPETGKAIGFNLDCTDEDGNFAITELSSGSYILAVNEDGKISGREPFKTFYYPNSQTPGNAAVIIVGPGDKPNLNIYVPALEETIMVEGVLLYSDKKAVADEWVEFKAETAMDKVEPDARTRTDEQGRFSLRLVKGVKGKLFGEMYTYLGEFENCPKLDAIIKNTGQNSPTLRTPVFEIQAEHNLYNVELKYPFPSCKKAP